MRFSLLLACLFFSFGAQAADPGTPMVVTPLIPDSSQTAVAPTTATVPKVVVVDGKKFFSLQGVRRYNPSHRPAPIVIRNVPGQVVRRAPVRDTSITSATTPQGPATPDSLLSVFAPDEKAATTSAAR